MTMSDDVKTDILEEANEAVAAREFTHGECVNNNNNRAE